MLTVYLVSSALLLLIIDKFSGILRQAYSWWLVPLVFLGLFLGFLILHVLVLVISILLVDLNKPADRFSRYYRFLVKHTIPLLFKITRVKVDSSGEDLVPENRRLLFVCNHQHIFDPAILLAVFPDHEIGFIGKKEIYTELPFIAKIMHKLHSLPIDRENDREAAKTIIQAARLLKDDKASVGLFPEGYTNLHLDEKPLLPFRNGAFKIAYRGDAPIVICVLNNTAAIPKRMFLRKTEVTLRVLGVMEPEEFKSMHTVELGNIIHQQMEEALNEIRNRQKD